MRHFIRKVVFQYNFIQSKPKKYIINSINVVNVFCDEQTNLFSIAVKIEMDMPENFILEYQSI